MPKKMLQPQSQKSLNMERNLITDRTTHFRTLGSTSGTIKEQEGTAQSLMTKSYSQGGTRLMLIKPKVDQLKLFEEN